MTTTTTTIWSSNLAAGVANCLGSEVWAVELALDRPRGTGLPRIWLVAAARGDYWLVEDGTVGELSPRRPDDREACIGAATRDGLDAATGFLRRRRARKHSVLPARDAHGGQQPDIRCSA